MRVRSLKHRILLFLVLCWGAPIVVFFAFTTVSYSQGIVKKTEAVMEDKAQNIAAFVAMRMEDAITLSQKPSYEKVWENAWKKYNKDADYSKNDYLRDVYASLKGKYALDSRFDLYAYYCYEQEQVACFSSRVGNSRGEFCMDIQPNIKDIMDSKSPYATVRIINGRIFLVRNLYTIKNFQRYGTLVLELNKDRLFQDVPESERTDLLACFGSFHNPVSFLDGESQKKVADLQRQILQKYDGISDGTMQKCRNDRYNAYLYQARCDNFHIGIILFADRQKLYWELYNFYRIIAVMMLAFVPLLCIGIRFWSRHIQMPIRQLLKASTRLRAGELGTIVEAPMPNDEFSNLKDSFNSMSAQIKELFQSVYDEKLARKDAQIQALQAQINPHFLNNTLEMMNWQARMSKDMVVSKMIEALGTVLNYRINRAQVQEIYLAEELQCTDAYFYIMSMRFGQRLTIEREIDEELLYIQVPPLILQPIVENAIVHGVESVANGTIKLSIFHDADCVYLQVHNTGKKITKEEKARIDGILSGDLSKLPKHTGRHTSIGIRNVNQRVHLVYGEAYGLTITQEEENHTISTITLPYRREKIMNPADRRKKEQEDTNNMARINK